MLTVKHYKTFKSMEITLMGLIIILICVCAITWWKMQDTIQQSLLLAREIKLDKAKVNTLLKNKATYLKAEQKFKSLCKKFDNSNTVFIAKTFHLMKKHQVNIKSFAEQKKDLNSVLTIFRYNFFLTGEYKNILAFLESLKKLNLSFVFDNYSMKKSQHDNKKLNFHVAINFYQSVVKHDKN